ncbi:MAG TPA: HEAT repeat domain-containing protein [Candidatus Polarisedimenticolaceae bacterium]|nr:HEAT repeat domain-containing protein [Candidatus Polarisedimenticolaceae bacterium]
MAATILVASMALSAGCRGDEEATIQRIHDLGRKPTEPNRNRIADLVHDPDRDVRANVLLVLNEVDPVRAKTLARAALTDVDGVVRGASVEVVASEAAGDLELAHALAAMASQDAAWQVRRRALDAIAGIDDPGVKEAIVAALSDSVRHVRRAALEAGSAHPGLLPLDRVSDLCAKDPDWENREAAARVLGASGDPASAAVLAAAEADPNEFVRAEAARGRRSLERSSPPPASVPAPAHDGKPGSGV